MRRRCWTSAYIADLVVKIIPLTPLSCAQEPGLSQVCSLRPDDSRHAASLGPRARQERLDLAARLSAVLDGAGAAAELRLRARLRAVPRRAGHRRSCAARAWRRVCARRQTTAHQMAERRVCRGGQRRGRAGRKTKDGHVRPRWQAMGQACRRAREQLILRRQGVPPRGRCVRPLPSLAFRG